MGAHRELQQPLLSKEGTNMWKSSSSHCPLVFILCFFLVRTLGRITLEEGRTTFKSLLCVCNECFFFKAGWASFCSSSAFDPSSFFFFGRGSVMMVLGTADGAAASTAGSSSEMTERRCEKNAPGFCRASSLQRQAQPAQLSSSTTLPFCVCGMALENFLNLAMKNPSILCVWG